MSNTAQSISILAAVILSFFWASVPMLRQFSVQITAILFITYFIIKHFSEGGLRSNTLMPGALTIESAILTSALLILIWFTGGVTSIFLPILYFLLFLGMFVLDFNSLTLLVLLLPTFLWATSDHSLNTHEIATLGSFIVMLPLLVFAKLQYQRAQDEKVVVENMESRDYNSILFLKTYLKPKLEHLGELSKHPHENAETIAKQTTLLVQETEDHLQNT